MNFNEIREEIIFSTKIWKIKFHNREWSYNNFFVPLNTTILHKNPQSADNLSRHNISIKIVLKVPRVLLTSVRNKGQRTLTRPCQVPRVTWLNLIFFCYQLDKKKKKKTEILEFRIRKKRKFYETNEIINGVHGEKRRENTVNKNGGRGASVAFIIYFVKRMWKAEAETFIYEVPRYDFLFSASTARGKS